LNTKVGEKSFLLRCWYVLTLRERPSSPRFLQEMKLGSIILNQRGKKSNPWNGTNFDLPGSKKFKKFPSVGKVTITLFWDCEGVVLVNAVLIGETVNCDAYIRTLTEYRKHFKQVQFHKNPTEILLQHDSARPQTNLETREAITKFGWTV
jgi:hypothetical protein